MLLAHALQLFVDLLRRLDSVGGLLALGRGWSGGGAFFRGIWRSCLLSVWIFFYCGSAGAGRGGTSATWSQNELGGGGCGGFEEKHVAAGAVEQSSQDLRRDGWTVLAEDAFVGDASGDLHSGFFGDVAEDLIEAGVVGGDEKLAISEGDFGAMRRWLLRGVRRLRGLRRREGREGEADDCDDWEGCDEPDFRGLLHVIGRTRSDDRSYCCVELPPVISLSLRDDLRGEGGRRCRLVGLGCIAI